jgi:hypothetical protein
MVKDKVEKEELCVEQYIRHIFSISPIPCVVQGKNLEKEDYTMHPQYPIPLLVIINLERGP